MKRELNQLLKDKNVLYIVLFLAVTNLFGYIVTGNLEAVVFFLIIGFLTSYFSKNMIVVMLVAMLTTNFLVAGRRVGGAVKEAMTNKENGKENGKDKIKDNGKDNGKDKSKETNNDAHDDNTAHNEKDTDDVGELDHAGTVEAAYDQIDKLLNSDAIKHMSNDTQRLAGRQAELMKQMHTLTPMVEQGMKSLEKLGGMEKMTSMIEGLSSIVGKFGG